MPTLAATKQAISYAISPFTVPVLAEFALAELTIPGLADAALLPECVVAGLDACGITASDPIDPTQDDVDLIPASDWRKFLAFAELNALDRVVSAAAMLPEVNAFGGSEHRVEFDKTALMKLLELRRKQIATQYPGVSTGAIALTGAWLTVQRGPDAGTEY